MSGKKIIAGPWFGEFGWELMRWQGIFRNLAHKGYEIVMVSRPGHEALYEDYIEDFIGIEAPPGGEADGWRINGQVPSLGRGLLDRYPGYTYMDPTTCMKIGVDPLGPGQRFIRYGEKIESDYHYILVHPRSTPKGGTEIRNWSKCNWEELTERLVMDHTKEVHVIGSKDGAFGLEHCEDYRGLPLSDLVNIIANADLVIGPSSGPMHLASLCGTPHLLWTDDKFWGSCNGTNRERYETNWNPLGTKVIVLDHCDWNPTVEEVYTEIMKELKCQNS